MYRRVCKPAFNAGFTIVKLMNESATMFQCKSIGVFLVPFFMCVNMCIYTYCFIIIYIYVYLIIYLYIFEFIYSEIKSAQSMAT